MNEQILLTIGNSLMGDDGAGPLLAALLEQSPAPAWQVFDGGSAPENVIHRVRAAGPRCVLVFDAVEMGLEPGAVRLVDEQLIVDQAVMTTHDLPVSFLMAALRETIPDVCLLGVQPAVVAFGYPLSPAVQQAVHAVHAQLSGGASPIAWPSLQADDRSADCCSFTRTGARPCPT
jgi:hydrogenase 3 maturation protease